MLRLILLLPALLVADDCSEEVLFRFFPKKIVMSVLEDQKVSQDKATAIANELYGSDAAIIKEVEARADQMDPNPFLPGGSPEERAKIFKEVLTDQFMTVMQKNGMNQNNVSLQMLDRIQETRFKIFEKCHREGKIPTPKL